MLLTCNLKHGRDFTVELAKARKVAEFALKSGSRARYLTTKDVKDMGPLSAISDQVLRKYSRNSKLNAIHNVQLTLYSRDAKASADHQGL